MSLEFQYMSLNFLIKQCVHILCICVQMVKPDSDEGDTVIFSTVRALRGTIYIIWYTPWERVSSSVRELP